MKQSSPIVQGTDLGPEGESEPGVTTPLLRSHTATHDNSHRSHERSHDVPEIHHRHKKHPNFWFVIIIINLTLLFVMTGDYMNRAPWMRIQEDIVCRSYYRSTFPNEFESPYEPIPEERCKVADVQAKVAMLRGWDQTFSNIPSILTAVPYGVVADKYGRKMVLFWSLVGINLSLAWTILVAYYSDFFAIEWYWAGNAFLFIGGGSAVARSMLFTILADVSSEDIRSAVFFQATAAGMVSTFVAIPLSWQLLKSSLFVPMIVSLGFVLLGTVIVLLMPETLDRSKVSDPAEDMSSSDDESGDEGDLLNLPKKRNIISVIVRKAEDSRFIFTSPMLCALSITFLVSSLHGYTMSLLFQFASERFHWSLANSSFLIPLSSVANFVVLLILLPAVYSVLTSRFGLSAALKDLLVTRGSLLFNIVGALLIALSPTPGLLITAIIVYALGNGFSSSVRSLITSLVRPDQVSRVYAVLSIVDTIGNLMSGPVLSEAYSWGLHRGGLWSGSVFGIVAVLFGITCFPIFMFGLPVVEVEED